MELLLSLSGKNLVELVEACRLTFPDRGFDPSDARSDAERFRELLAPDVLKMILGSSFSSAAAACISRFAECEVDYTTSGERGLGRISATGFPRLGAVFRRELSVDPALARTLEVDVARTLQAGYIAILMLLVEQKTALAEADLTEGNLWERWIPHSFEIDEQIAEEIDGVVDFSTYWVNALTSAGLGKRVKDLKKPSSDLTRSLGGLTFPGVALALLERHPNHR